MTDLNTELYDQSVVGQQEGATPGQPPGLPPSQYRFSPDELKVLQECNRESFYQRSMPMGTMLGLGTYLAVQSGKLNANPRFGAFPKVALAVTAGYFIGKLSYQQACAEKLMNLPGSYIGQLLRERKEGKFAGGGFLPPPSPNKASTMFGANPKDIYSDAGPGSSLDLDTDRPIFSGDDTYRPDSPGPIPAPEKAPKGAGLSYDDLRRKNRSEYTDTKQDPYRTEPILAPIPPVERTRPAPTPRPTNKYGDVME